MRIPFTFIRLARCNLRCSWCDTSYSFGRGDEWTMDTILEKVKSLGCRYICITGGEPLLQKNVHLLMDTLCDQGYFLTLETGGSLSIASVNKSVTIILDVKCPMSGMSHKNSWENFEHLKEDDEVKFVVQDQKDYRYALDICKKYALQKRKKQVLLSPVHGILDPKNLIEWILRDKFPARVNLQLHKYVWDPETKGV